MKAETIAAIKKMISDPTTPFHEREAAKVAYDKIMKNGQNKKVLSDQEESDRIKKLFDDLMALSKVKTMYLGDGNEMTLNYDNYIGVEMNLKDKYKS